ncbi:hypothetical protein BDF22DRAFT_687231 [Syncephalis plumigaleata]|nr:hypothetical protein BDF22DRAFT_687231 [Syncephalis plumigaleata]
MVTITSSICGVIIPRHSNIAMFCSLALAVILLGIAQVTRAAYYGGTTSKSRLTLVVEDIAALSDKSQDLSATTTTTSTTTSTDHGYNPVEWITLDYFVPCTRSQFFTTPARIAWVQQRMEQQQQRQETKEYINKLRVASIAATATEPRTNQQSYIRQQQQQQQQQSINRDNDDIDTNDIVIKDESTIVSVNQMGPAFYWPLSTRHRCRFQWPIDITANTSVKEEEGEEERQSNSKSYRLLANTLKLAHEYDDAALIVRWPASAKQCKSIMELYYAASEHIRLMKDIGLPTVRRLIVLISSEDSDISMTDYDLQQMDRELRQEDAQRVRNQSSQLILSVVVDVISNDSGSFATENNNDDDDDDTLIWNSRRIISASNRFIRLLTRAFTPSMLLSSALLFTTEPLIESELNITGIDDYVATNWILFLVVTVCAGYVLIRDDDPPANGSMANSSNNMSATINGRTGSSHSVADQHDQHGCEQRNHRINHIVATSDGSATSNKSTRRNDSAISETKPNKHCITCSCTALGNCKGISTYSDEGWSSKTVSNGRLSPHDKTGLSHEMNRRENSMEHGATNKDYCGNSVSRTTTAATTTTITLSCHCCRHYSNDNDNDNSNDVDDDLLGGNV